MRLSRLAKQVTATVSFFGSAYYVAMLTVPAVQANVSVTDCPTCEVLTGTVSAVGYVLSTSSVVACVDYADPDKAGHCATVPTTLIGNDDDEDGTIDSTYTWRSCWGGVAIPSRPCSRPWPHF